MHEQRSEVADNEEDVRFAVPGGEIWEYLITVF